VRDEKRPRKGAARGFTLYEVVLVVTILSLILASATIGYRKFMLRAYRSEALVGLDAVKVAQLAYSADTGKFSATFDELTTLDFPGKIRIDASTIKIAKYTYQIDQPWGLNSWRCSASANIDGDAFPDVLMAEYNAP
jgi:prepilin-type N-terminal cleavage/methylation domain-containing protein